MKTALTEAYRRHLFSQIYRERMVNQMAKRGENIYKRKCSRWEAHAIKGYNEHGKAVYSYFYGRFYKEAKDKMFLLLPYVNDSITVKSHKAG